MRGLRSTHAHAIAAFTLTSTNPEPVVVDTAVPGAQSTDEDVTLTFSNAGGNAITVSDGTAANTTLLWKRKPVPRSLAPVSSVR